MIPIQSQLHHLLENTHKLYMVEENVLGKYNTKIYSNIQHRVYVQYVMSGFKSVYTEIIDGDLNEPHVLYCVIAESIILLERNQNKIVYQHNYVNNDDITIHSFHINNEGKVISYNDDRGNYWDEEMNMERFFQLPNEHIFSMIERCVNNIYDMPVKKDKSDFRRIEKGIEQDKMTLKKMNLYTY